MAVDIISMINKKDNDNHVSKKLIMEDINHDLIISLLAIPIYGKQARDEEILSVIINSGKSKRSIKLNELKSSFDNDIKTKTVKKCKDGQYQNSDGFTVLATR